MPGQDAAEQENAQEDEHLVQAKDFNNERFGSSDEEEVQEDHEENRSG